MRIESRIGVAAWLCVAIWLAGCASPAQTVSMVPRFESPAYGSAAPTATVVTIGGLETHPLGKSQISNQAFTDATSQALLDAGVLVPVVDRVGDYHLDIAIVGFEQPRFAFPMTVGLVTRWSLRPRYENEPLWTDVIAIRHTEPFTSAFWGIRRLRLANEGAARQNIHEAVGRIGAALDRAARDR